MRRPLTTFARRRGGEALDMLRAMGTGHPGSMTTVHANDPRDALEQLATVAMYAFSRTPVARSVLAQGR